MKYLTVLCLIFSIGLKGQTISYINKSINLPDSLFKKELRIYKRYETSNGIDIFRYYYGDNNKWVAEVFRFYDATIAPNTKEHFDKSELKTNSLNWHIWAEILDTNIAYLSSEDAIKYKLRSKIQFANKDDQYGSRTMVHVLDGTTYEIYISGEEGSNHIVYSNPESYFKEYPTVDELESIMELLTIVRNNFSIWKG
jgi:hypothetical protein